MREDLQPSDADKFMAMAHVLRETCGLGPIDSLHERQRQPEDRTDPRILAIFPLKNEQQTHQFLA